MFETKLETSLPPPLVQNSIFLGNSEGWMKFGPFWLLGIDGASGNIINESAEVLAVKTKEGWQTTENLHQVLIDTEYLLISSSPYLPENIRNLGFIPKPEVTIEDNRNEEDSSQTELDYHPEQLKNQPIPPIRNRRH